MDKTIKAEWVAALRNPAAIQIRGKLGVIDGGRCCLGVLCDLAVRAGVTNQPDVDSVGALSYEVCYGLPPASVLRWADLDERSVRALAKMNDTGASFARVADEIDRRWPA